MGGEGSLFGGFFCTPERKLERRRCERASWKWETTSPSMGAAAEGEKGNGGRRQSPTCTRTRPNLAL